MQIKACTIENFKSIVYLRMEKIDMAVILVGKNNTGKSGILDAIRAVYGYLEVEDKCFNDAEKPIQIRMTLQITPEDLHLLWENKKISQNSDYNGWLEEFQEVFPDYKGQELTFTYMVDTDKDIFYLDSNGEYSPNIIDVLPKLYYISHERELTEIQDDIFDMQEEGKLKQLKDQLCIRDPFIKCTHCFACMEGILNKSATEMSVQESARLLEYKLYHLNLKGFTDRLNEFFHKNSGRSQDIKNIINFDVEQACRMETYVINRDRRSEGTIQTLGAGMKSIYILSLLEAYVEQPGKLPSITLMEDPEIFLHPQMQKVASEILFRLSKKNQMMFTTHSPNMLYNFSSKQIKQVVLDENYYTTVRENPDIDDILDDLGYSANDLMNVSFVFIVEGKQDSNRLPILLEKYYSEIYDEDGNLQRISIIPTNSCTNIKTYANLKYINKLYLKDQFLMIRDSDGKNPNYLVKQLCSYYGARAREDQDNIPRVQPKNVLVLKYYSFENYFLDPKVMAEIGVINNEEEFYNILYGKYKSYLYKLSSMKRMIKITGARIHSKEDLKKNMENIKIYVRGHNLFDIFYGKFRGNELEILRKYIEVAPREVFANILDAIDRFVYFENRKIQNSKKTVDK